MHNIYIQYTYLTLATLSMDKGYSTCFVCPKSNRVYHFQNITVCMLCNFLQFQCRTFPKHALFSSYGNFFAWFWHDLHVHTYLRNNNYYYHMSINLHLLVTSSSNLVVEFLSCWPKSNFGSSFSSNLASSV